MVMNISKIWFGGTVAIVLALTGIRGWSQDHDAISPGHKERGRIALSQGLPNLNGDHLKATLVEVNYGPGESSLPHSHPCAVIGYMVQGTLRNQVNGGPEVVYKAGETFYEAPNGVHAVSANASLTEPAKFVASFVCDRDMPLSVSVPETAKAEEK
jgi:quercetin dioxygenase-like cupin family protein